MKTNLSNNKGFTLVELLIVLVILGAVAALVIPKFMGVKGGADGMAKHALALEGTKWASGVFNLLGSGGTTPTNPVVDANNSLEDVIFTGLGVSSTYQSQFDALQLSPLRILVKVTTEPVDGTSQGVYEVDSSIVSIATPANNREMIWQFTNTPSEQVSYLVGKYDPSTAFNAGTADTAGQVRYTAATNGTHTLTLVISK